MDILNKISNNQYKLIIGDTVPLALLKSGRQETVHVHQLMLVALEYYLYQNPSNASPNTY